MTIIWRSKTQKAANPGKRLLGTARLTKNEREIAENFTTAVRQLTSTVDTAALTRALGSGSISNAVRSFDWGQFGSKLSENRLALLAQVTESGKASAKELSPVIGHFAFDVTDPRALAWAASRSGEKVVDISQTLQNEIRGMITSSFANQIDPRQIAKELELKVGLFDRWANAVTNSYDKNHADFISQGMSPGEADRRATELADAYRERLISARAENIARTEVMTAANQGRLMSWQQAGDKGLVDLDASMKQWIAEGSACEICDGADQDGPIPVNDDWELDNGDTVDMPPGHPSCRCTAVLIPMEPGDVVDQPEPTDQTEGDGQTEVDFSPPDFDDEASADRPDSTFDSSLIADQEAATQFGKDTYNFDDAISGLSSRVSEVEMDGTKAMVYGEILDKSGDPVGDFLRVVNPEGSVKHDIMNLDPSVQNNGFGARWLETVERSYRDNGISQVNLTAGFDVGGYAWARQGFSFDFASPLAQSRWGDLASAVESLGTKGIMSSEAMTEAMSFLRSGDMASLASRPYGRELLLGSEWPGMKVI